MGLQALRSRPPLGAFFPGTRKIFKFSGRQLLGLLVGGRETQSGESTNSLVLQGPLII